jgi:hypothetical protein
VLFSGLGGALCHGRSLLLWLVDQVEFSISVQAIRLSLIAFLHTEIATDLPPLSPPITATSTPLQSQLSPILLSSITWSVKLVVF